MLCECCADVEVERATHLAEMDKYAEHFAREYRFALQELDRLEMLLRDVMWYNFETVARGWCYPWFESYSDCTVELFGVRSELHRKRGHIAEKVTFPVYYYGHISDAPPLPPGAMPLLPQPLPVPAPSSPASRRPLRACPP